MFTLWDYYSPTGLALFWFCFWEGFGFAWGYGAEHIYEHVEDMLGHKINPWLKICWKYVSPFVIMVSSHHLKNFNFHAKIFFYRFFSSTAHAPTMYSNWSTTSTHSGPTWWACLWAFCQPSGFLCISCTRSSLRPEQKSRKSLLMLGHLSWKITLNGRAYQQIRGNKKTRILRILRLSSTIMYFFSFCLMYVFTILVNSFEIQ